MRILVTFLLLAVAAGGVRAQNQLSQSKAEQLYQKGSELVVHKNFGAARKVFQDYLEHASPTDPRRAEAEYYIAFSALNLQHIDGEKLIDQYISHYPSSPKAATAYYDLALFFYNDSKFSKAIQYFRKVDFPALTQDQQREGHFKWGYSYFNLRQLDQALEQFNFVKTQRHAFAPAANYYAGFIGFSQGKYDQALEDLKRAETNASYANVVPYLIANIYYKQQRYDELLAYTEKLAGRSGLQNAKDIAMLSAEAHFFKGDYAKAAEAYEQFLAGNVGKGESNLLFRAGYANYALGNQKKALDYLNKAAASRDSVSYYASYYLGILHLQAGEKLLALNAFDHSRRIPHDDNLAEESTFQLGKLAYDAGRMTQSIDELEKFLVRFPQSRHRNESREILAQAYVNGNNFNKAIEYIESLPNRNPQVQQAYQKATYLLGSELFNKNRYAEAVENFEKSLRFPVNSTYVALASFWAGEAYSIGKRYRDAIPHYQRVLGMSGQVEPAIALATRYGLGYAWYALEEYDQALPHFREFTRRATRSTPHYVDGLIRMADCHYIQRDYRAALTAYESARSIGSPDNDYILLQLGMIHGIGQRYAEARNSFTSLIEHYPRSTYRDEALYQRAQFEIEQGNYQAAADGLSRLISDGANSRFLPYAYLRRASSYYNLRQYDRTIADYAAIIRQFPHHPVAQEALLPLQDALSQAGRSSEFNNYMAEFKRANPDGKGLEAIEFETAKNTFFDQQYAAAVSSLENFVGNYPQTTRLQEARYYIAESRYRLQEYNVALPIYEELAADRTFNMGNRVAGRAAEIHFRQGNYAAAVRYYHRLESLATNKADQYTAWAGLMESFYQQAAYDSADAYARTILERGAISAGGQNKASLYLGKTAMARGDFESAKDEFLNTLNSARDEFGAEAKYHLAEIQHLEKQYRESYETLVSLTQDFGAYEEWVGKAFLLMADNFVAMNDLFQAKATLQSLIDHFPLQSIRDSASARLREIERMEAERQQEVSADSLGVDTLQNNR